MNHIKILFLDLDDTLLNSRKEITPKNAAAIETALKAGHRIVINSGRPLMAITAQIDHLNLNKKGCYAIAYNGGVIYDSYTKQIIYQKTLSIPDVQHIFAEAQKYGLYCQTYSSTCLLTNQDTPELHAYISRFHLPCLVDPHCPSNLTEEPVKALVIGDESREKSLAYRAHMEEWSKGRISIFFSNQLYLEHVAAGVSKGAAIQWLCGHLNIPVEHTIAAGDAENDIPMLKTAHIGAAVANAAESVKAVADYITRHDCNHDAVAEIIETFIL